MLAPPAFFQDGKSGLPRHLSWDHAVSDIAPCCLTERNMHAGMARRPCHFYHVRCPAAGLCNDQERGLRYHASFRGCTYGPGYRRPRLSGPRPTAHDSWTRTRNRTPALHHRWLSSGRHLGPALACHGNAAPHARFRRSSSSSCCSPAMKPRLRKRQTPGLGLRSIASTVYYILPVWESKAANEQDDNSIVLHGAC